ncbi:MAG: hypothetical protein ACRELY_21690 [Polyangiaceae bacterium]
MAGKRQKKAPGAERGVPSTRMLPKLAAAANLTRAWKHAGGK